MFNPTRDQARLFFMEAWRKHGAKEVVSPLEDAAIRLIAKAPSIAAYAFLAAERARLSPPEPLAFLHPARLPKRFRPRGASRAC